MAMIAEHHPVIFRGHHQNDRDCMPYPEIPRAGYASPPLDLDVDVSPDAYGFTQGMSSEYHPAGYDTIYADATNFVHKSRGSPTSMYHDDSEVHLSTASAPSAPSSTVGSPHSNPGQLGFIPEYQHTGLGVSPGIVGDYMYSGPGMDDFIPYDKPNFVDPSLIHPEIRGHIPPLPQMQQGYENISPHMPYPNSPALSGAASPIRTDSQSPYMPYQQFSPFAVPAQPGRRPSLSSYTSHDYVYSGDESKEKQRCPLNDCGKIFKDLKAHMLTHQLERPEKCPIQTCDYHIKGFARKYDKNRHTLTHYKGTMVCGFCPGPGSAAEKSFNRADVFKRHLTAVHNVEQTPPNSRKKTSASANSGKKLTGYPTGATGKCSTCSATFSNAQDFYEHLDDCVLRIVQQEDPAEAINAQRLAEVENDKEVHQTLKKNQLPLSTPQTTSTSDVEDDDEMVDDDDALEEDSRGKKNPPTKRKGNPPNGVQKSRGMTHSRGGVALPTKSKSRKNRRDYPSSWGFDKGQMTMKKRVMTVFDGPRRLAKDDMMLSMEQEVRVKLSDGKSYVTDLDVKTMERAEGFLGATDEEKGIWISDDPTEEQMQRMLEMSQR
ncbi:hypothetical protein SLS62_004841 [Diatrype stigma]|uniref:C2H2-type domain-containing protein n=1 Tax=Diatrype stigma TaxID=117547 RepID=A0AAN9YTA4_9PEZI